MDHWLTGEVSLWLLVKGEYPEYIDYQIWRVLKRKRDRRAQAIIRTRLDAEDARGLLTDFPHGCTLELRRVKEGQPDYYSHGIPILKAEGCSLHHIWLPTPQAYFPDEQALVMIWGLILCRLNFFPEQS